MSKEFRPGLAYVFSSKKYRKWSKKVYKGCKLSNWHKSINGRKIGIISSYSGIVNSYEVSPEWCKCIGLEKESKKRAAKAAKIKI